jgi:hypothetical protein
VAQDAVVPVAATQPAGPVAPLTFVPHVIAPGTRTATSCASLTLSRHSVRVGRRAHIVATVRSGGRRLKRARVEFKTRRLQVRTRTDGKGRARLTIRAKRSQHRLRVRTVVHKRACGTATEYVLVKR